MSEEEELGNVVKDLEGVTSQIEAHKAETERRERRQKNEGGAAQGEDMEGVLVEEADSAGEVGVQVEARKRRKVAGRGRFGGGSASAWVVEPTFEDPAETACS